MNRLALFDCDGTMVDSQANICISMQQAFIRHDLIAPDHHLIRRIVGLSLPEAVRQLLPEHVYDDAAIHTIAQSYKDIFAELRQTGGIQEPLYDGLPELIAKLVAAGWMLGVATGKSDRGLRHCLETHGLEDRFMTLQTADRHPSKPHPAMVELPITEAAAAPERTFMIGDTSFDMVMGVSARTRTIGVNWGYHDAHELLLAGAEIVVDTMDELHKALHA